MSAEFLAMLAGFLLSLVFSYVPRARSWFDGLAGEFKRLVMLALLLLVAIVCVALACAGLAADFQLAVTCDRPGIVQVVWAFFLAAAANQTTFMLSPKRQ